MRINMLFDNMDLTLLVFARMAGFIFLNPLLSRKNVPPQVRIGLVLGLTLLLVPTADYSRVPDFSDVEVVVTMLQELVVGMACGYVFQIFYYLLFFAGDTMDMQFGMSMAKVFDPGTNIQMSVTGNLLSILFMLYLFATDSHLLLIRIFVTSYQILPAGLPIFDYDLAGFLLSVFLTAFSLIIRLTLPFIAAEFTVEIGMGVLMKLIPQIHVFVINIQFKMLLGLLLLFLFARPISGFLDQYTIEMFHSMEQALYAIGGQGG